MNRSVPEPAEAFKTIQKLQVLAVGGFNMFFTDDGIYLRNWQAIKLPQDPTGVRIRSGLHYCDILFAKNRYLLGALS